MSSLAEKEAELADISVVWLKNKKIWLISSLRWLKYHKFGWKTHLF